MGSCGIVCSVRGAAGPVSRAEFKDSNWKVKREMSDGRRRADSAAFAQGSSLANRRAVRLLLIMTHPGSQYC